jgi:hypothetical protein
MKFTLMNIFMAYPPIIYFVDDLIVTPMRKESIFSTDDENWPSTMKNITDLLYLTIVNEFVGYAGHRLMHEKPFCTNTTKSTTSSK